MEIVWEGKGADEKGIDRKSGKVIVQVDPKYFRPAEVDLLLGNAAKAEKLLGWKPVTTIDQLAEIMMKNDLKDAAKRAKNG
jgi:GDPmannose 4,6-dehydratase